MKRIEKAIQDYLTFTERTGRGALYMDDANGIRDRNTQDGVLDPVGAIFDALEAGFMIGYRCAKRERKEGR